MRQLVGMRGLMANPDGFDYRNTDYRELPRRSERSAVLHLDHGARKGLADTALKTANLGLPDPSSGRRGAGLVVTDQDCGTKHGMADAAVVQGGGDRSLRERVWVVPSAEDIVNPDTDETMFEAGTLLTEDIVDAIEAAGIDEVKVRTSLNQKPVMACVPLVMVAIWVVARLLTVVRPSAYCRPVDR